MELDYEFNGRSFWNLTLDSQRNHPDFSKNCLNQNQESLDSRYVAEEEEDDHGFRIGFHGLFHGGTAAAQPLLKKRSNLTSSPENEYAPRLGEKMGENYQYQQLHRPPATGSSSRLGLRNYGGGEIVEVQGGHIVKSTGRKDRHSKVCTAKGPRDRRVRLSATTAIQFYDVQDRLGYDRPSKAVDWLIKKAKSAIDDLAELPAWKRTITTGPNSTSILDFDQNPDQENPNHQMGSTLNSSFLPPPNSNSPAMQFQFHQSFPPPDLLSRTSNHNQDLRLSLQSFKDPILRHHHQNEQCNSMFLDGSGWPEKMAAWGGSGSGDTVSGGFVFSSPSSAQTTPFLQTLFGQTTNNQLSNNNSQRGPLQSSYSPPIRAWIDQPPPYGGAAVDQQLHHPSSLSGFISDVGGFPGFLIPARIQGEQEEHDGISNKPSSVSSDSRH